MNKKDIGSDIVPTHMIHLAIAKKVNEQLNINLDELMLGNVLPDICEEKDHTISHYQAGKTDLEGLANPDKFVEKYKSELKDPIMLGYLMHILADRYCNKYMITHFYIYDENNNGIGLYLKGKKKILDGKTRKHLKHREHELYGRWLMTHGYVSKFTSLDCIEKVKNIEEATFNKEKLKNYILIHNKILDKKRILSKYFFYHYKITTKKELDNMYNGCINYIIDYIKKIYGDENEIQK